MINYRFYEITEILNNEIITKTKYDQNFLKLFK